MREIKFRCQNERDGWEISGDTCFMYDFWSWMNSNNWKKETLGQYTGLKDKNGKDIYEGDILFDEEYWYKVIFEDGCFVATNEIPTRRDGDMKQCEITGNIYNKGDY